MKEDLVPESNSSVWQSPVKRLAVDGECGEAGDRSRTSCKRIKTTQVNGFIVYTRTRKTKFTKLHEQEDENAGLSNHLEESKPTSGVTSGFGGDMCRSSSVGETNVSGSSCVKNTLVESSSGKVVVIERLVTGGLAESPAVETDSSSLVDVVIDDINFVELLHEAIPVEILSEGSLDFEVKRLGTKVRTMGKSYSVSEKKKHGSFKRTAQIYKSIVRMKKVNNLVPENVEVLAEPDFGREGLDEQSHSVSLADKSILIRSRPETVRDLFETGLLDGLSVVYMGTVKSQAFPLRGIIRDGGILCSCSSCDWANVISTSKFEIHACKQYRRASQYICFENGKSLLDVLNISRNTPLHALEATILDAVDYASKEKRFTCKRCKGPFPFSSLGHRGFLCKSCSEVETSQASLAATRTSTSAPACITSPVKSRLKITRKPSESTSISPVFMSSLGNSTRKITRKALRQALVGKAYLSASTNVSSQKKCRSKFKKMLTQHSVTPKALKSVSLSVSSKKRSYRLARKDQGLHKLVFDRGGLPEGTELGYYARGQKLLGGYKMGAGIYCYCCKCEVSPSLFEAHAGWASRRKPYFYIYTSNGVSLHEWATTFSHGRKYSANDNNDLCVICADGGNLLLCDSCPRAFHIECVSLPSIPRGNWHCKYCENKFTSEIAGEYNVNSSAVGQLEGVDPVDQLAGRCIRVVKNMEAETNGCVLCSGSDFCRSGFGPRTIIICDQCEKEYHIGCLSSQNIVDLKELPKGNWFCSMDCTRINSTLQKLLLGGAEKLSDSSLGIIQTKQERNDVYSISDLDIRWRLISGKVTSPESRMLLSQALAIFHDCFDPIVDPLSGSNLIPRMVYGKTMQGQDYGGICCAVLTVNATVVSAGLLRVFGREVAELPLVATRMCSREKGYFQLLFSCIEKLLSSLNVESIVFGVMKVGPEGGLAELVVDEAEGRKVMFANQGDIDEEEDIFYFNDSSDTYHFRDVFYVSLSGTKVGRVIRYDMKKKEAKVIMDKLRLPNGLALSKNGSFVVTCESSTNICHRIWVKGPKSGTNEVFATLPGSPDNIRRTPTGDFWVALHCKKNLFTRAVLIHTWVGRFFMNTMKMETVIHFMNGGKPHGIVVKLSGETGEILEILEDSEGKTVKYVSEAYETKDGKLWIGSVYWPAVWVLDTSVYDSI